MIYLSKGIVLRGSTEHILRVSRCGMDFTLTGRQAALWLDGRFGPLEVNDVSMEGKLRQLQRMGLVELTDESGDLAIYRLLTQCVICPAKKKPFVMPLTQTEAVTWQWISKAGLRLTLAELTALADQGTVPDNSLLGEHNRQALTQCIYSANTIFDSILEAKMEHSSARDSVVRAVLGLLRKKRLLLI